MSEFSSHVLSVSPPLPPDSFYGLVGGFAWKKYLIAIDKDITAPSIKYEVNIFSPKCLDWLLLISPDGHYINFDAVLEAMKSGFEWVECDAEAQGDAYPLSAKNWRYNKDRLSNGMALYLISEDCRDIDPTIQPLTVRTIGGDLNG